MTCFRRILSAFFQQEKYFWKLLCLCCTGILVFQLLEDYLWIKPTVSSFEQVSLSSDMFPDILVCREAGFDPIKLGKYGYKKVSKYVDGVGDTGTFVGWSGLHNMDPLRKQVKQF